MGFVGSMLGLNGGVNGTGFSGPSLANISNPVTDDQIKQAYTGVQNSLGNQQSLLTALQGQQGLANQSNVYNQLSNIAAGQGPNPAQAMLNQETAKNVQNQAALMASQRGAGANVGLMARQAAQQGANAQQQAVGQGATMQANQSLGALGQMGGVANQMAANQIGQTNANTNAQQAAQNTLLNAQANYNSAQVGNQGNVNQANAGLVGNTMGMQGSILGGAASGLAAAALLPAGLAEGGEVEGAYPGQSKFGQFLSQATKVDTTTPSGEIKQQDFSGLQKGIQDGVKGAFKPAAGPDPSDMFNAPGASNVGNLPQNTSMRYASPEPFAQGGKVPALVSPGERYLKPADVKKVERGANPMAVGEKIPGKPKVSGAKNSYANDTVPKTLDEGGIVLPRSITMAKHPHWAAHKFVSEILAKQNRLPAKKAK